MIFVLKSFLNFRVGLLITTLLVLVNIFNSMLTTTPGEADGLTALAVWIVACIIFVFLSLLSYVFILARMKMPKKVKTAFEKLSVEKKKDFVDADTVFLVINSVMFLVFLFVYTIIMRKVE